MGKSIRRLIPWSLGGPLLNIEHHVHPHALCQPAGGVSPLTLSGLTPVVDGALDLRSPVVPLDSSTAREKESR